MGIAGGGGGWPNLPISLVLVCFVPYAYVKMLQGCYPLKMFYRIIETVNH